MNSLIISLPLLLQLLSCANTKVHRVQLGVADYSYIDEGGTFSLQIESREKKKNFFYLKRTLRDLGPSSLPVEQSVVVSEFGNLSGNLSVLRPTYSKFEVWFEKDKFISELILDVKRRSFHHKTTGPQGKEGQSNYVEFPKGNGLYCFFSQLIDCLKVTGFFSKAIEMKAGLAKFYLIWDGYPYIQEQYPVLPKELFSWAIMKYEELDEESLPKFSLSVGSATFYYILSKDQNFHKLFWVSEGLSITPGE